MTQTTETPQGEQPQDAAHGHAIDWSPTALSALQSDPTISYWLKPAINDLARRDPLDALNDAELLRTLMKARWRAIISETDGT